tara:strand:+ start:5605 stop:6093 length:489 start_codon:yes stop_codon:yes gene_type:complete
MKIHIFLFLQFFALCGKSLSKQFYTINLKSQKSNSLDWNKFKYIIVGNQYSDVASEKWGEIISVNENINLNEIAAIAGIPKWMTKTPGSKYLIQKTVLLYRNQIDIFIDWEEKFVKKNHITEYPTILVIGRINGELVELGRVSGQYNVKRWNDLRSFSNNVK